MNTRSVSIASKETLSIVSSNSPTSPYLSKSDLDNIHNDIKSLNYHISAMLEKPIDTSSNIDKQEEQITEISSKLSTYEDGIDKLSTTKTKIWPLSLQIT